MYVYIYGSALARVFEFVAECDKQAKIGPGIEGTKHFFFPPTVKCAANVPNNKSHVYNYSIMLILLIFFSVFFFSFSRLVIGNE